MLKTLTAIAMLALMPVVSFAANFVEGKDYKILANPTLNPAGKQIEVREFFWYGCPHCFRLDPHIEAWLKTKPADVVFVRTPAALNPVWEGNARGYYAVEMMGLVEKTHIPLFNTIHERQARIFDEASLTAFYKNYGVDPAKFKGLYNSFAVNGKVSQGKALAQKYQIEGVPAVVVNGKYLISGETAKVLQVTDFLIAKERTAIKK
ncbi:MAG TPA: thiol:disulfide interchange protein DsbA/DsbL [Agitococcus sp.]|nr:thiol:disulfide interchange protein DsbA/DsbL [Agitococcus sp.]HNJ85801.1 thiol:disulfide interchange protein DsbA/DsbL [Agitococcus sp.]HNN29234.1 thiol:disulfide interchange protein DsbA/DsbL [Agitococcus sp.]HNP02667.1 thiol:disulfide interchange protein DsbA/DsbL [Agitococcus sp.]